MAGQLPRDGDHAGGRHRRFAPEETLEDDIEHPPACLECWIQLDPADERPEELLDHLVAETIVLE